MNATAHQETGSRPIYLDHNATTPIAPVVAQAMWPCIAEHFGNPSSSHHYGRVAKAAVDHAREQVAALIGAQPDEIIFTSGGTEANNLAIRGTAGLSTTHVAVTTAVEHPATAAPLALLVAAGWNVHQLPVDTEGRASADAMPPPARSAWAASSSPRTRWAPSSPSGQSLTPSTTPAGSCTPTPPRRSVRCR